MRDGDWRGEGRTVGILERCAFGSVREIRSEEAWARPQINTRGESAVRTGCNRQRCSTRGPPTSTGGLSGRPAHAGPRRPRRLLRIPLDLSRSDSSACEKWPSRRAKGENTERGIARDGAPLRERRRSPIHRDRKKRAKFEMAIEVGPAVHLGGAKTPGER